MKTKIGHIEKMVVHHVGCKAKGEGVGFTDNIICPDEFENDLITLLQKSFKLDDLYHFYFESTVDLNPIYSFVKAIFNDKNTFLAQSKHIAKILYDCSTHPRIKDGDVSIFLLNECEFDGQVHNAIAIFKSETPQKLLQINHAVGGTTITKATGISLSKIEKGCLIYQLDESDGYKVAVIDNTAKNDSKYWINDFLHVKSLGGAHHQTSSLVDICNDFINTAIVKNEKLSKVDKAMISARSKQILVENESISLQDYAKDVFQNYGIAAMFNDFIEENGYTEQVQKDGIITIDKKAIKRRKTKVDTIKLDNNFELRIHGGEELIVKGYDQDAGMNYYQIYFEKES